MVRVLAFDLWGRWFESRPGCFMLESWSPKSQCASELPMHSGLQCRILTNLYSLVPPTANYPLQYDPGFWTRRKTKIYLNQSCFIMSFLTARDRLGPKQYYNLQWVCSTACTYLTHLILWLIFWRSMVYIRIKVKVSYPICTGKSFSNASLKAQLKAYKIMIHIRTLI